MTAEATTPEAVAPEATTPTPMPEATPDAPIAPRSRNPLRAIGRAIYEGMPDATRAWVDQDVALVLLLDANIGLVRRMKARHSDMWAHVMTYWPGYEDQACWYPIVGSAQRIMLTLMFAFGLMAFPVMFAYLGAIGWISAVPVALALGALGAKAGNWLGWRTQPTPIWLFRWREGEDTAAVPVSYMDEYIPGVMPPAAIRGATEQSDFVAFLADEDERWKPPGLALGGIIGGIVGVVAILVIGVIALRGQETPTAKAAQPQPTPTALEREMAANPELFADPTPEPPLEPRK